MPQSLGDILQALGDVLHWFGKYTEANTVLLTARLVRTVGVTTLQEYEAWIFTLPQRTLLDQHETMLVLEALGSWHGGTRPEGLSPTDRAAVSAIRDKLLHSAPPPVRSVSVAVNGKVVAHVQLRADATEEEARAALSGEDMAPALTNATPSRHYDKKFIYVPGNHINIVTGT